MNSYNKSGQAGTIEGYGKRGVWVPDGMSARDIMEGAHVLEDMFDVPPYESREMMRAILAVISPSASCSAKGGA